MPSFSQYHSNGSYDHISAVTTLRCGQNGADLSRPVALKAVKPCVSLRRMTTSQFHSDLIFDWYDRHGRSLPWRARWPDLTPAYHVWLSEIMLQQTVVATVIPYFLEFIGRWPTVCDLAAASHDDVMAAWAGLGYYARARNLHRAAQYVCHDLDGVFPQDVDGLRALPGVGPYTAGAISAIAFGQPATVVDGNIERVLARFFGVATPLPAAKSEIGLHYDAIRPSARPSDFPQALMDFANAVCTPKSPGCGGCPLGQNCVAGTAGTPELWPVKAPKKEKPQRRGIAFVAMNEDGHGYLITRPDRGMLGGMLAFPSGGWTPADPSYVESNPFAAAPFIADWHLADTQVTHVFTHFTLTMDVALAHMRQMPDLPEGGFQKVRAASLPTLMRKVWDVTRQNRFT